MAHNRGEYGSSLLLKINFGHAFLQLQFYLTSHLFYFIRTLLAGLM